MPQQQDSANAIRALAMDAVQQAGSGHPGMPMGMADIAVALWQRHLRHNPANPRWANRDRFVLSNGHGSMLLYALLHLSGYELSIDDLKKFRQLHSKTPGHPEYGYTPGVETTTGPLGQGLANAVGMALAEKMMSSEFNRPGFDVVDHHTYAFVGDGCLMEGISHEVCSLAGTLGLRKLVVLYDDNGISIDGHVQGWFSDDTPRRFEAYGWQVLRAVDGHDVDAVSAAIAAAHASDRPVLICCKTLIGKGSPNKQGSHDVHGAALGAAEVAAVRAHIGWPHAPFEIPAEVYAQWDARASGAAREAEWDAHFARYSEAHPQLAAEFQRRRAGAMPDGFDGAMEHALASIAARAETIATRKASQNAIALLAGLLPELAGGSADLASSNLTLWPRAQGVSAQGGGNYVYYGVREFGMAAMVNGMALYGGLRPFCATFLMFSEYARNALRMAALMGLNSIFVFTHDSIGLGEDGPTHQPVEQTATLRMIPNMDVWRPADTAESLVAWQVAIEHRGTPSCLIFCRQNLPYLNRNAEQLAAIRRGGYVLKAEQGPLCAVLIATGSEVVLALEAQALLAESGIGVRVVSMPSPYNFDRQDVGYQSQVLPELAVRVAVEAGVTEYWRKYVGLRGAVLGLDRFGESAPAADLYRHFGLTAERIADTVRALCS